MNKVTAVLVSALASALLFGCKSTCPKCCKASPFAQYDNATTVSKMELKRTSQSWDGAPLPDYFKGKPELVVMRYVFPVGSRLQWHHHPVINFGILQQGELTIFGVDGKKQVVHPGEAIVEMVGPIHYGRNTGDKPVVLDMFYLSQKGMPLAV
ncbi:MAG: cupin domain-containing protein, partial [Victivallales bacterium]|nr:cupin domain-containing protein [Victivallales bacterium]